MGGRLVLTVVNWIGSYRLTHKTCPGTLSFQIGLTASCTVIGVDTLKLAANVGTGFVLAHLFAGCTQKLFIVCK